MQIIIAEAKDHFRKKPASEITQTNILNFASKHRLFDSQLAPSFSPDKLKQIKNKIKQARDPSKIIYERLQQLGLYLKKQTNRLMFEIYELILKNPSGLTYKEIEKKIKYKIEIVNISHYCCRLKKMNFVELKHDRSQKVVYPKNFDDSLDFKHERLALRKIEEDEDEQNDSEINQDGSNQKMFLFSELSIMDNIWVNVSSVDSYQNKGITNEEIKMKINKPADSKLIMKVMDNASKTFKFKREMVSEGKIFEHRYHNVTPQILSQLKKKKASHPQNSNKNQLYEHISKFLSDKFPQFQGESFLFDLINAQLNSYKTAMGTKSARRTCTPIKLVRYIKILNKLDERYPQTHTQLKKYLIDEEKSIQNGIMHQRSIVGILEGLVSKEILRQKGQLYYPEWEAKGQEIDPLEEREEEIEAAAPRKKVKLSSIGSNKKQEEEEMVNLGSITTIEEYRKQLRLRLLVADLDAIFKITLKKAFKSIMFAKRSKAAVKYYEPQLNILGCLDDFSKQIVSPQIDTYEDYVNNIDYYVSKQGKKEQMDLNKINYEMIKLFRKFPERNEETMKHKFGSNWREKVDPMIRLEYLKQQGNSLRVVNGCRLFI